jgi:hypothetical protein
VLGEFDSVGMLILSLSCSFRGFAAFYVFCWSCGFSFFKMTILSFLLASGLLVVLHGVSDLRFKLCVFVVNGLIKGEIEKPSGQFLDLIVMSH